MLELPEALVLAEQLNASLAGRAVRRVDPPTSTHRFCWFNGDPADYDGKLAGCVFVSAYAFGGFVELAFSNGQRLCINDGVNVRLLGTAEAPRSFQLLITFHDGAALCFTVAMYGGIYLHGNGYDNTYYTGSRNAVSPFSPDFAPYYWDTFARAKPTLSAKAFLATEQRFAGVGNGVTQDILFAARINPRRKLQTISQNERETLLACMRSVLADMRMHGGRDTEKDLYGASGGYLTCMSKSGMAAGCPLCGGAIVKEAYLGGSVYYCPVCQPLTQA